MACELGTKLGPVLVQLGPDFGPPELPALAAFLPTLPRDVHVAVEFRQRGWINDGIIALPVIAKQVKVAYGYVNNHFSGHSPANVREMKRQLGQVVVDPAQLGEQLRLF